MLVTGIVSVPAADAVAGVNVTEIAQVPPALSVPQLLLALKLVALELVVVAETVPTCSAFVLVLSSVTVCCVDELPGTLLKTSALGVSARPGSVEPYPVSAALAVERFDRRRELTLQSFDLAAQDRQHRRIDRR